MNNKTNIDKVLEERGSRYGEFRTQAQISQRLKYIMSIESNRYEKLTVDQTEALEMIVHKIARILNGDSDYIDNWVDIAGYAQLVVNELEKKDD